jgi:hypothetical protein
MNQRRAEAITDSPAAISPWADEVENWVEKNMDAAKVRFLIRLLGGF